MNSSAVPRLSLPAGLDVSLVSGPGRQRKYNFSWREREILVSLIERHDGVVESRAGDGVTWEQKVAAWADVQARFNALNDSAMTRSMSELKKCYWNLKQKTKKVLETARETPGVPKVHKVLWRIAQLAPEQFEGLLNLHCELVDTPYDPETKGGARQDTADAVDFEPASLPHPPETSDSPGRSQSSQPSPPSELDIYPIPSDYLSVELGSGDGASSCEPAPAPPAVSLPLVSLPVVPLAAACWTPPVFSGDTWKPPASIVMQPVSSSAATAAPTAPLPDLHRLVNGNTTPSYPPPQRVCEDAAADGGGRGVKRAAAGDESPTGDAGLELRRVEHEARMRLLRRENELMTTRHQLEMHVLHQQLRFWEDARQSGCAGDVPFEPAMLCGL